MNFWVWRVSILIFLRFKDMMNDVEKGKCKGKNSDKWKNNIDWTHERDNMSENIWKRFFDCRKGRRHNQQVSFKLFFVY